MSDGFLTSPQQRDLFQILEHDRSGAQIVVELKGSVDIAALKESLSTVVERHEIFQTDYTVIPGMKYPLQVLAGANLEWSEHELSESSLTEIAKVQNEEFQKSGNSSTVYISLVKEAENKHHIILCCHALAMDYQAVMTMLKEWSYCYDAIHGSGCPELEEPLQYIDYAAWLDELQMSDDAFEGNKFWSNYCKDFSPRFSFALEEPTTERAYTQHSQVVNLPSVYTEQLNAYCSQHDLRAQDVLCSMWLLIVSRMSGQSNQAVSFRVEGRDDEQLQSVMGIVQKDIPICVDITEFKSFLPLVKQLSRQLTSIQSWQDFYKWPECWREEASESLDIGFAFYNSASTLTCSNSELSWAPKHIQLAPSLHKLALHAEVNIDNNIELCWRFDSNAYTEQVIQQINNAFITQMRYLLSAQVDGLHNIPIFELEEAALDNTKVKTSTGNTVNKAIHQLVAEQIKQCPDKVALEHDSDTLSYQELGNWANAIAQKLDDNGVEKGEVVAVFAPRSFLLIAAMLGISRANAVYLPLDTEYPEERIKYMIEDSNVSKVICLADDQQQLEKYNLQLITVNKPCESIAYNKNHEYCQDDDAYMIYTSGSTGNPKGTLIPHHSVIAHTLSMIEYYQMSGADRSLLFAPANFDPSIEQIYVALASGATLCIRGPVVWSPAELAEKIAQYQLSVVNIPTAYWNHVVDDWQNLPSLEKVSSLRLMIVGGDRMVADKANSWNELFENTVRLINAYGPTEATVTALAHEVGRDQSNAISIGQPLQGREAYILDEKMNPLPPGFVGELYLGGMSLAKGYINRDEETRAKFVTCEIGSQRKRLYRTGDRGYYDIDGLFYFTGRNDAQLKVRGYRVELGEIESQVHAIAGVTEAVVIGHPSNGDADSVELMAFFTAEAATIDVEQLKNTLKSKMPDYMIPNALFQVESFPMTPSGKVDRKALVSEIDKYQKEESRPYLAPTTETEAVLAKVWESVFSQDKVSINSSFFGLYGNSLKAMRMIANIRDALEVKLTIKEIYDSESLASMAALIDEKKGKATSKQTQLPEIKPLSGTEDIPLSYGQERMYFLDKIGESTKYHMTGFVKISGQIDTKALEKAIAYTIARHDSLRTKFSELGERLCQIVEPHIQLPLQQLDMSIEADITDLSSYRATLESWVEKPFNLGELPLIRALLVRFAEDKWVLGLCMHHIVADGLSLNIILDDITSSYRDFVQQKDVEVVHPAIQYTDYAKWQRDFINEKTLANEVKFWNKELSGYQNLEMLTDHPRPKVLSGKGERVLFNLDKGQFDSLKSLCDSRQLTVFSMLISAVHLLLQRYSNQTDFCLGIPVANREQSQIQDTVGLFLNTVAFNLKGISQDSSVGRFLETTQEKMLEVQSNQALPFEKVVELVEPDRDLSRNPLFQVLVNYLDLNNNIDFAGCDAELIEPLQISAKFDLTFDFANTDAGGLELQIEYSQDLYNRSTIDKIGEQLLYLLESLQAQWLSPIKDISYLSEADKNAILSHSRGKKSDLAATSVKDLFAQQVQVSGHKTAIKCEGMEFSYETLDARSNQVANMLLQSSQFVQGDFVGILMERSENILITMLGIIKAGGAFVPLDPTYPAERLGYIVENSDMRLVICSDTLSVQASQYGDEVTVCRISETEHLSRAAASKKLEQEQLAYAIYTSGSTGKPKGVQISHGSFVNFLMSMQVEPGFNRDDSILAITPYSFDIALLELFLPIVSGGTCVIGSNAQLANIESLANTISDVKPSVLQMTPSTWSALLNFGIDLPNSIRALCGGESMPTQLKRQLLDVTSDAWNMYGPTETTIWSSCTKISRDESVALGQPILNTDLYILDENLSLSPQGAQGEIYIGGAGLSTGYIARDDLNSQSFIDSPWGRLFKTGDMGRWVGERDNLSVQYLGRKDTQVKVRGFRIELSEIESILEQQADVSAAVAMISGKGDMTTLEAFVQVIDGGSVDTQSLLTILKQQLPHYMVPNYIQLLEQLPKTPSGKVDRKALANQFTVANEVQTYELPKSKTEQELSVMWCDVLGVSHVSKTDGFFKLKGHSLKLASLYKRIKAHFDVTFSLRDLFEADSLEQMASLIDRHTSGGNKQEAIIRNTSATEGPLSFAQQGLWLADQIDNHHTRYNNVAAIALTGSLNTAKLEQAINCVVEKHAVLRTAIMMDVEKGIPHQKLAAIGTVALPIEPLHHLPEFEQPDAINKVVTEEEAYQFNLSAAPLWRARLLQLSPEKFILVLNFHHIITDGWTTRLFISELCRFYEQGHNEQSTTDTCDSVSYIDYAVWQRDTRKDELQQLRFWQQYLADMPNTMLALSDKSVPQAGDVITGSQQYELGADLTSQLRRFSDQTHFSPFMLLQTAFNLALAALTGEKDIVIGTDVANREHYQLENTMGFFVNQVALRNAVDHDSKVSEFLDQVKSNTLDVLSNQEVPFEKVVNHLRGTQANRKSPIFQIKLFLDQAPDTEIALENVHCEVLDIGEPKARLDLTLGLLEYSDTIKGKLVYNANVISEKRVDELLASFEAALRQIAAGADTVKVGELINSLQQNLATQRQNQENALLEKQSTLKITGRRRGADNNGSAIVLTPPSNISEPMSISASQPGVNLRNWINSNKAIVDSYYSRYGAILFRNFNVGSVENFSSIANLLISDLVEDNGEHNPVDGHATVQTPVQYSSEHHLLWHNENTFNSTWPSRIMFGCQVAALEGGETPLVDTNAVYQALPVEVVEKFKQHGVMYVRNYSRTDDVGLGWESVFCTTDKAIVERKCKEQNIRFEWLEKDKLRTYAVRPAFVTDQENKCYWVAQIQHWHFSCLDDNTRQSIATVYSESEYPRNCYFGNGDKIEDGFVSDLLALYKKLESSFAWQDGDALLVDNVMMAHGRNPYKGDRKLLVSMGNLITFES
ncbi:non-ribosomal peptide synthetase [Pseudoalteromonas peptidolytica]|uniref:Carrier domain-containing protein n=1 Tax=Pseudoalteromonas peptidolytica F12-50-A1 TaxID=1315280 RepID=A0A8I0MS01_9GAMM|nr:non-ribosomal peptide synthetase [Pseudoalteromonas peptidolytica]MBE0344646.1 hypothetical protein [Pseudoalteromonas peptidolytica F12-50-A1]NLR15238.1 amino acid adenylation domain-containing protein [Pseudoalteromonas peptidolytica]GEK07756.1 hypothetical protein PPE03_00050 [Pseudoalteromonas peptidolytica]